MLTILKNIGKFITDPKNTRMLMLGAIVLFLLLFLHQCGATRAAKEEVELQKQETKRIGNNYDAAMDTIEQYQVDGDTWRAEKSGYELTLDELENKYADLLGDFDIEKNRQPKVVIQTEYIKHTLYIFLAQKRRRIDKKGRRTKEKRRQEERGRDY